MGLNFNMNRLRLLVSEIVSLIKPGLIDVPDDHVDSVGIKISVKLKTECT